MKALLAGNLDPMDKVILRLAWQAGLQATEMSLLKWSGLDYQNEVILVAGRSVPLPEELARLLSEQVQRGPYVLFSRRNGMKPMTRINIARRAGEVLNAGGMPDVRLPDLSNDYVIRQLRAKPIEEVCWITGLQVRSLQNLYRRCTGEEKPPYRSAKEKGAFSYAELSGALDREGDTLAARIVWLSWQGGLNVSELAALNWGDVDLDACQWGISDEQRTFSPELAERMRRWPGRGAGRPVLQGERNGKRLDYAYISRCATAFFLRYHLKTASLRQVCGQYGIMQDGSLKERVLAWIDAGNPISVSALMQTFSLTESQVQSLLRQLEQEHKIPRAGKKYPYHLAAGKTKWEEVLTLLKGHPGDEITLKEVQQQLGVEAGHATYYLNRACEQGLLIKIGRGVFHVEPS